MLAEPDPGLIAAAALRRLWNSQLMPQSPQIPLYTLIDRSTHNSCHNVLVELDWNDQMSYRNEFALESHLVM